MPQAKNSEGMARQLVFVQRKAIEFKENASTVFACDHPNFHIVQACFKNGTT